MNLNSYYIMIKVKRAYYYVFYKLYRSIIYTSERVGGEFLSDFKAVLAIGALEIWVLVSIFSYYSLISNISLNIDISSPIVIIPLILIFLLNYFSFIHTDVWKEYNKEFDVLPKEKNKKYGMVVWSIIILIICNTIFSYYLLFQRAKRNQTGPFSPLIIAKERREDSLQKAKQIENLKKIYGEEKK